MKGAIINIIILWIIVATALIIYKKWPLKGMHSSATGITVNVEEVAKPTKKERVKDVKTLHESTRLISSLLDPAKLATLTSSRAANPRFNKLMYHIHRLTIEHDCTESEVMDSLYSHLPHKAFSNDKQVYCPAIAKQNLNAQFRYGKALGLFSNEHNLNKLKKGGSPTITKGKHAGKITHIDHLIPKDVSPELENSFLNLTFLSSTENLQKGNSLTNAGLRRIKALENAGIGWKPSVKLQVRIDATTVK